MKNNMEDTAIIKKLKRNIIRASYNSGEGHIPSAFSVLDILWILYDKILDLQSIKSKRPDRDMFILSKGHAAMGLYAILEEKGFIANGELENNFCKFNGILGGHPDSLKVPGIEASTGSLGHGLRFAIGIALGYKIKNINSRVVTLIGDGECNEGSIWESALLASHHKLDNLCCIIDYNHSTDRALYLDNIENKFKAFGWATLVIDGHDNQEILNALLKHRKNKPMAIIANTIKGNGCIRMENEPAWHHRSPNEVELGEILNELS